MRPEEIENELIKIFTSSNYMKKVMSEDTFYLGWKQYTMWMEPKHNKITIYNPELYNLIFILQEIPTKALAILAITCRPAYEFYRKHWK